MDGETASAGVQRRYGDKGDCFMTRIRDLTNTDLIFLSDSQDVQALKEHLGGTLVQKYDSFFVKIIEGDYSEV